MLRENNTKRVTTLVNKTNRFTEFQFLLVIITLHVSGSLSAHHQELLSRTKALVQFIQLRDRVLLGSGRSSVLILVALGHRAAKSVPVPLYG
jgi:hypothetical protein